MSKYQIDSVFEGLHDQPEEDSSEVMVDLKEDSIEVAEPEVGVTDDDGPTEGTPSSELSDDELFDDITPSFGEDEDEEEVAEDDDDQDELEDDEEDDDVKYSKNVKKRIDRERRRANRERELREATEARLAKIEARQDMRANEEAYREEKAEIESKLSELRTKKAQAIEEGDTDSQIDIDDQMLDLKADLRTRKAQLEEAKAQVEDAKDDIGIDVTKLSPKARSWIEAHPDFNTDEKFRRTVLAADNFITQKGSNPNSDAHYRKLDDMLVEDFPDYFDKKKPMKKRKPAVNEGGRKATVKFKGSRRRGRIVLTAADKENMRRFNMDPTNPDHLREYARNKTD